MSNFKLKLPLTIVGVSSIYPDSTFLHPPKFSIGKNCNNISRLYVYAKVDELPNDAKIICAYISIPVISSQQNQSKIFAVKTITPTYDFNKLTWNRQPCLDKLDPIFVSKMSQKKLSDIDITSTVEYWFENTESNYGMIISCAENNYSLIELNTDQRDCESLNIVVEYESNQNNFDMLSVNSNDTNHGVCDEFAFRSMEVSPTMSVSNEISIEKFQHIELDVFEQNHIFYSSGVDTSSSKEISCFVKNIGSNNITTKLQVSPNNIDFIDACEEKILNPDSITILIPCYFAKYTRICLSNNNTCIYAHIDFQMQLL